jgi:cysteinyl-tRNA synthetase
MNILRVNSVTYYARATLYIKEIISQIRRMINKGYAYETSDGVYFNVRKFKDYGKLSNQNLNEIIENARGVINEDKKHPEDFALWKKMKPGEPYWESPWGKGRPGWHIEDTAITETFFGYEYDIHGGGSDLIFPHHEAEIAQMRSISNRKYLARYWIHTGMVNVNKEKMSKSLKNYIKIKDILKDYSPEVLRFALINSNYNTSIEYSLELMNQSRESVDKINTIYNKLKLINSDNGSFDINYDAYINSFNNIMENNFDTRRLIAELLEFVGVLNKNYENISYNTAQKALKILDYLNSFLDILYGSKKINTDIIDSLILIRNELRKNKFYDLSDLIRKSLQDAGIYIEDNGDKTIWYAKD